MGQQDRAALSQLNERGQIKRVGGGVAERQRRGESSVVSLFSLPSSLSLQ